MAYDVISSPLERLPYSLRRCLLAAAAAAGGGGGGGGQPLILLSTEAEQPTGFAQ